MTYIAKFKCSDGTEFDISENGVISLGAGFIPPGLNPEFNLAAGTSANVNGGSTLMSTRHNDRDWNISLKIVATNESYAVVLARRVDAFLKKPGTKTLEWSGVSVPVPLWGQFGVPLSFEIIACVVSVDQLYALNPRRNEFNLPLGLRIKPFAKGKKQKLASALGGVWLDTLGSASREPWGLRVMEGTTNKITNSVYANVTAFDHDWTASAGGWIQTTEPPYTFPGSTSAAYVYNNTNAATTHTISVNAGNTNKHSFSAIVRRPDGAAVTASDCQIYYGAAKTTTYQALGDGKYLIYSDNITGINSATSTGIQLAAYHDIYLIAYQMEEKAYHTPIGHGDQLGWAWTGTAFDSTATRTAGRVSISVDNFVLNTLSVHMVWKPDYPNTQAGDRYLFSTGATGLRCYFQASDDKIYINDNTNTAATAALTFSAGDVLEILVSCGNAGLAVYVKNHTTGTTSSGTNASFSSTNTSGTFYIGSDNAAANHAGGIFQLFDVYDDDLTSAQNTALQTALGPICSAGLRVGDIPLFWNKDGDYILDNCDDSTHDNWGVAMGIPGNAPADTEWTITPSAVNKAGYWLLQSSIPADRFILPTRQYWYNEVSGSADATCSGGEYNAVTFTAKAGLSGAAFTRPDLIEGNVHQFARMKRASGETSINLYPAWYYGYSTTPAEGPAKPISINSTSQWYYAGSTPISLDPGLNKYNLNLAAQIRASAATSTVVNLDYEMYINGKAAYILNAASATGWTSILLRDKYATAVNATLGPYKPLEHRGDVVDLDGGKCNIVWFVLAGDGNAHTITDTATMTKICVTPRRSLL